VKCFVMMPYASEFDDVFHAIKRAAAKSGVADCFRLDEQRPGGRILGRLVNAIHECDVCIADLSGRNPNVMWELGYAMANNKHPIIVTRDPQELPFDVFDVHKITYDRTRIFETLERPLESSIEHSIEWLKSNPNLATETEKLRSDVKRLHRLVALGEAGSHSWGHFVPSSVSRQTADTAAPALKGAWVERVSASRVHARVISGELVAPYCWQGNNQLSGLYHEWRRRDDLVFARYAWRHQRVTGVSVLKVEHPNLLVGNWWNDGGAAGGGDETQSSAGSRRSEWERAPDEDQSTPPWAEDCFREIEEIGVERLLKRWHAATE
jgi:hypothetical protein